MTTWWKNNNMCSFFNYNFFSYELKWVNEKKTSLALKNLIRKIHFHWLEKFFIQEKQHTLKIKKNPFIDLWALALIGGEINKEVASEIIKILYGNLKEYRWTLLLMRIIWIIMAMRCINWDFFWELLVVKIFGKSNKKSFWRYIRNKAHEGWWIFHGVTSFWHMMRKKESLTHTN